MRKVMIASTVPQRLDRLGRGLAGLGIQVKVANSSAEVWPIILDEPLDAIIVDASTSSGELDAWILCCELESVVRAPLIVLIRPGRTQDRLRAFRAGAIQCLTVPVSPAELAASLDMVPRADPARGPVAEAGNVKGYSDGWLIVDLSNRRISRGGETCGLTAKEYELLERLIRDLGNIVPAEMLSEAAWRRGRREVKSNRLKTYISRLRQKIEADPSNPIYIVSQHGFGYAFMPQLKEQLEGAHALVRVPVERSLDSPQPGNDGGGTEWS